MILTYWTSINIIFLACLHLGLQEATPTEILPWLDGEFFVPRPVLSIGQLPEAENVSTPTPAWLLDNEVQDSDQSHTERNISSDGNHEEAVFGSEQIQNDISLPNKTWIENETEPSITPTYNLTDERLTEVAIEEPPTVPLVIDAPLSTSHWPEISSEFYTSDFSTASIVPLDPVYEPGSSSDESSSYLLKESDVPSTIALSSSSYPNVVSDVPIQPYIWDMAEKTDLDSQTHEKEMTTEPPSFMTHEDDGDEFLATEDAPLVTSEMSPAKVIEESTIPSRKETDEEMFSLVMAENLTGKSTCRIRKG